MKTLNNFLALVTITAAQLVNAQSGLDMNMYAALRIEPSAVSIGKEGRYDLVALDMRTATRKTDEAYMRVARATENGFEVRIIAADGTVRMTGTFADAAMEVPNGEFHYYHANGNLESTGMFVNGTKKGTWQRFSANGKQLAERNYGTSNPAELELEMGWSTMATNR